MLFQDPLKKNLVELGTLVSGENGRIHPNKACVMWCSFEKSLSERLYSIPDVQSTARS